MVQAWDQGSASLQILAHPSSDQKGLALGWQRRTSLRPCAPRVAAKTGGKKSPGAKIQARKADRFCGPKNRTMLRAIRKNKCTAPRWAVFRDREMVPFSGPNLVQVWRRPGDNGRANLGRKPGARGQLFIPTRPLALYKAVQFSPAGRNKKEAHFDFQARELQRDTYG